MANDPRDGSLEQETAAERNYELDRIASALEKINALRALEILMHYAEHGGEIDNVIIEDWVTEILATRRKVLNSRR
jgi:hypothetical protein